MNANTHQDICTIGHVIEIVKKALDEYDAASGRLSLVANLKSLRLLEQSLNRIRDRLELASEDKEVLERLDQVTVGNQGMKLLNQLDGVLLFIRTYLLNSKSPLQEDEVTGHIQALSRYAEVLKVVLSRDKKNIMQRIEEEVLNLNTALSELKYMMIRNDELSLYEQIMRLDRLRPLRSAYHDSHGAPKPCEAGVHKETISDILEWSVDHSQPMLYWLYGDSRLTTSAIAQSIATQACQEGRLVSSFFFNWAETTTSCDPEHFIPTIMYQVARFDHELLQRLYQIALLVNASLGKYEGSFPWPLLIVIDALDACNNVNDRAIAHEICMFLQALSRVRFHVKVMVTGQCAPMTAPVSQFPGFPKYLMQELQSPVMRMDHNQATGAPRMLRPNDASLSCASPPVVTRIWTESKRKTVEGHICRATLYFNGDKLWGPYHCHDNAVKLQSALKQADPRLELRLEKKAKSIEGHTCTINIEANGIRLLNNLSCHHHMDSMANAITNLWAGSPPSLVLSGKNA